MSTFPADCPGDCNFDVPEFEMDDCNPDIDEGQISQLFIAKNDAADFVDWTALSEWTTRKSNVSPDDDAIRYINIIGDLPAPETNEVEISKKRKIVINRGWVLNFRTEETSVANYNAMRTIQCGSYYKIWFESGKYLYGDNSGIANSFINWSEVIPEDYNEFKTIQGTVSWDSKIQTAKCISPLT